MTKEETLDLIIVLNGAIINSAIALQAASEVLKQAHSEGWTDNDPRWAQRWQEADLAQAAARARLD